MEPKPKPEAEVEPDDGPVMVRSEKAFALAMGLFGLGLMLGQFFKKTSSMTKPNFAPSYRVDALERRLDRIEAFVVGQRFAAQSRQDVAQ
jgi:hypothetical protein